MAKDMNKITHKNLKLDESTGKSCCECDGLGESFTGEACEICGGSGNLTEDIGEDENIVQKLGRGAKWKARNDMNAGVDPEDVFPHDFEGEENFESDLEDDEVFLVGLQEDIDLDAQLEDEIEEEGITPEEIDSAEFDLDDDSTDFDLSNVGKGAKWQARRDMADEFGAENVAPHDLDSEEVFGGNVEQETRALDQLQPVEGLEENDFPEDEEEDFGETGEEFNFDVADKFADQIGKRSKDVYKLDAKKEFGSEDLEEGVETKTIKPYTSVQIGDVAMENPDAGGQWNNKLGKIVWKGTQEELENSEYAHLKEDWEDMDDLSDYDLVVVNLTGNFGGETLFNYNNDPSGCVVFNETSDLEEGVLGEGLRTADYEAEFERIIDEASGMYMISSEFEEFKKQALELAEQSYVFGPEMDKFSTMLLDKYGYDGEELDENYGVDGSELHGKQPERTNALKQDHDFAILKTNSPLEHEQTTWVDPAGGTHDDDETDPAKMYEAVDVTPEAKVAIMWAIKNFNAYPFFEELYDAIMEKFSVPEKQAKAIAVKAKTMLTDAKQLAERVEISAKDKQVIVEAVTAKKYKFVNAWGIKGTKKYKFIVEKSGHQTEINYNDAASYDEKPFIMNDREFKTLNEALDSIYIPFNKLVNDTKQSVIDEDTKKIVKERQERKYSKLTSGLPKEEREKRDKKALALLEAIMNPELTNRGIQFRG